MTSMRSQVERLRQNISAVFLGNPSAVDQLIVCLLARGHVLIEDVPGVGKTVLATALARSIDCTFSRIQLTPDLLPSDILGVTIYNRDLHANGSPGGKDSAGDGGRGGFEFKKGPIFANIVLADEINRTPPRTQTALLEAMSEATVTVDGRVYTLDRPFMIVATQNPFDFEGTYALPENQLDRFFMRINLGYPKPADEARVLFLRPAEHALHELKPVLHASDVLALQERVDQVRLDQSLIEYIIALADATRRRDDLHVGLSPRGALSLAQAARATAVLHDRDYVIPEDVLGNVTTVCAHRIISRAYTGHSPHHLRNGLGGRGGGVPHDSPPGILQSVMEGLKSPA
ncbi:MAG: MoxR family ATPase [Phycisphaerales bacterium]|nr:MoxR family ATPase [Phycisphaerales bacterium]